MAFKNTKIWREAAYDPSLKKSPERKKRFRTSSGIEIDPLYAPSNVDDAFSERVGFPGQFPFTRGVYPSMYRSRAWTIRQYAGFGTARETNQRFHSLLKRGQNGLSVAFDCRPRWASFPDDPLALGEVGRVGVAIDTVDDMAALMDQIPLATRQHVDDHQRHCVHPAGHDLRRA
jgi:methylmalonyl-CoA mutase N-terminal domain/subunit